jgi:hypothetical protein
MKRHARIAADDLRNLETHDTLATADWLHGLQRLATGGAILIDAPDTDIDTALYRRWWSPAPAITAHRAVVVHLPSLLSVAGRKSTNRPTKGIVLQTASSDEWLSVEDHPAERSTRLAPVTFCRHRRGQASALFKRRPCSRPALAALWQLLLLRRSPQNAIAEVAMSGNALTPNSLYFTQ